MPTGCWTSVVCSSPWRQTLIGPSGPAEALAQTRVRFFEIRTACGILAESKALVEQLEDLQLFPEEVVVLI